MCGEVTLLDDGIGSTARLVQAAGRLFGVGGLNSAALVGGLAVTARLATVHRVTNDVDAVVDEASLETLSIAHDAVDSNPQRIEIDGVKVDVMPTNPLPFDEAELPDDGHHRLFVLAHRWALESARTLTVQVVNQGHRTVAEAEVNVATSPALLACKFHAIADRRDIRRDKQESDARDIVGLARLLAADSEAGAFSDAPFDLGVLVQQAASGWLIDDSVRTARLMNLSAGPSDPRVEPADLASIGKLFLSRRE